MESLERQGICLLFIDPVGCHGIVRNIFYISLPQLRAASNMVAGVDVDLHKWEIEH